MDIKTACIDSRRNAIFASYDVKDPGTLKMIEDYFNKVEEFAKDCKDAQEFETKFSTSELNKEYSDLFVLIMQSECDVNGNPPQNDVEDDYSIQDEIAESAAVSARHRIKRDIEYKARDIPVVGDAITAKRTFDFFSRFKKKKDDE